MSLAERYKQARLQAGLSQSELAELTFCTTTAISKIERNFVANPRNLDAHAKILGVSEAYLRFGDNTKEKEVESQLSYSPQYRKLSTMLQQLERQGKLKGDTFQAINGTMSLATHY